MSSFRAFLFVFMVCFSFPAILHSQNYWLRQNSPTTKHLYNLCVIDSEYYWAAGDSGTIVNSTNGGLNWEIQQTGINGYVIDDIFFINRSAGWALSNDYLGQGTIILKTSNGGTNWAFGRIQDSLNYYNSIFFLDPLNGYIAGHSGMISRTTDGGETWKQCDFDTAACFSGLAKFDIFFVDEMTGYSCGGAIDYVGITWRTTNGGLLWKTFCLTAEPLNRIRSIGNNSVAAMGGDFEFGANFVHTTNGTNWTVELTNSYGAVTGFDFRTPAECWAVLSFSTLMAVNVDSMKPGTPWTTIEVPDEIAMYDIEFISPVLGWSIGKQGAIFKYNPSVISVQGSQGTISENYGLSQNYPNPFNPITNISYSLPQGEFVVIRIFDLNGAELAKYNEGFRQAGEYSVIFDAGDMASGVYFYSIETGNFRQSRKMVLIK